MMIDSSTGLVSWMPGATAAGSVTVTVVVRDPAGALDTQTWDVAIEEVNTPPRIVSLPNLVGTAGATYAYAAEAVDPDDAMLTWAVTGPAGMTVTRASLVSWNIPAGAAGNFPVTLTVTDGRGAAASQSYGIGVAAEGDTTPPTVAITSPSDGATVIEAVPVLGTAADPAFREYRLELCREWGDGGCMLIGRGNAPVTNGILGTLNPATIINGTWRLVLTAFDAAGNVGEAFISVSLEGSAKPGMLRLEFTDLVIETRTASITLSRIYDSLDLRRTELGNGWRYEWHMGHLERPQEMKSGWNVVLCAFPRCIPLPRFDVESLYDHPLRFVLPDGRRYEFLIEVEHDDTIASIHPSRPVYFNLDGSAATLRTLNADFVPYSITSFELLVNPSPDPRDPDVYEDEDLQTPWEPAYYELTTDFGEVITFRTSDFEVIKFSEPDGVTIDLSGGDVNLDGENVVDLVRGPDGLVKAARDLMSGVQVTYAHDANGDLVAATTVDGFDQTFTYATGSRMLSYHIEGRAPELFEYDDQGRVLRHVLPSGAVENMTYDDAGRRVVKTDAAGNQVITEYNALGQVTSITDPLGHTTTFTYVSGSNDVASRTDPLGHVWKYEYDSRGRRTVMENPLGEKTIVEYAANTSRILQTTDGEGRVFREIPDASGRVTAFVLPDGTTARTFSYPAPNTTVSTDPFGNVETTVIDDRGRVTSEITPEGTWTSTYDDANHTRRSVHPDGTITHVTTDPLGRATRIAYGDGTAFNYAWGSDGTLDSTVAPDGTPFEWEKNPGGEVGTSRINGGVALERRHDALGRLASEREPNGARGYGYDAAGRLTAVTTATGTVNFTYDAGDRLMGVSASNGHDVTVERDDAGRITALIDAGGRRSRLTYDHSGRPTSYRDPVGRMVSIEHDANGRVMRATYPDGRTIGWTYHPSDETSSDEAPVKTLKDIEGIFWSYDYDASLRLNRAVDPTGGVTTFDFDGDGRVTSIIDALSRETMFAYGPSGLTSTMAPGGRAQMWTYDSLGRQATWTRGDGSVVSYGYTTGALTMSLPSGDTYVVETDDTAGSRAELGAPGGGVFLLQDEHGEVSFVQLQDGATVEIARTPEGAPQHVRATTPGGASFDTSYRYDVAGNLASVTDPSGDTTGYQYDDAGRLAAILYPNGTSVAFTRGLSDRPETIRHLDGSIVVQEYTYRYAADGRLLSETTPHATFTYGYDGLGRVASVDRIVGGVSVERITYGYDPVGNLRSRTDGGGVTTYSYDADDRLLSKVGPEGTAMYTYSLRGALSSVSGPIGTTSYDYDDLDRLARVVLPSGSRVEYRYDVTGRLLARIDASGERRCLPLPARQDGFDDCAVTYAPDGSAPEAYAFGAYGLAAIVSPAGASYIWPEARGTVSAVTDASGAVRSTRAYDEWGRVTAGSGRPIGYGYIGERQDPATGLIFLRSRWYDPSIGRFLTPDAAPGATDDPRTLNRYTYAASDPKNKIDRSGEDFTIIGISVSLSIGNTLSSIRNTIKFCLGDKIRKNIGKAVATWAARNIGNLVLESVAAAALGPLGAVVSEGDFQEELAKILCGDLISGTILGDLFEFEVLTDRCGGTRDRRRHHRGGDADGSGSAYFNCLSEQRSRRGVTGVDIVFDQRVPVELKLDFRTYKEDQARRWCRFAAKRGLHTAVWVYYEFPEGPRHDKAAGHCYQCWDASACPDRTTLGSIYIGLGVKGNNDPDKGKRHFYVPDPPDICPGRL